MASALEIEEDEPRDGEVRVRLRGELDVGSAERVQEHLEDVSRRARQVTIDLSGLTFMDSTGVRIVWATAHAASQDGFELKLIQGPEQIRSVFEMSGLISRLPFADG